jgi:hypothetical protein
MMRRTLRVLGAATLASCLFSSAVMAQSPINNITTKMTGVSGDLAKKQTGEPVQTQEKAIVHDLDELIAALEKQCEGCRNGLKRNNPNRGMRDSMLSSGTGGMGPLGNPAESQKDWAKLSSRERDRILQSMSEGFPPEYRTVLERYYRRLAEEKTIPSGGTEPKTPEPKADKP